MAHTVNDYLELITSQYNNSPKFQKWVERLLTPYIDTQKLASTLYTYFDIDKAKGKQLDMLGEVIGVNRLLPFQPEGSGTGTPNPIFNKSAFTIVGTPSITDDGVASGFSANDYVIITNPITSSNYTISGTFNTPDPSGTGVVFSTVSPISLSLRVDSNNNIVLVWFNSSGTQITKVYKAITFNKNTDFKIVADTETISLYIDGTSVITGSTVDTIPISSSKSMVFGINIPQGTWGVSNGTIDLKSISITVDGEEVFSGSKLNPLLDDENYRFLLKAQILKNVWKGTNQNIYDIWTTLHSDIAIAIKDNQDMTVTVLFTGDLNKIQQEMIKYGMIVPKAQGVKMFYAFSLPPLFSYDQDTEYFKGYDEGNWAENIL